MTINKVSVETLFSVTINKPSVENFMFEGISPINAILSAFTLLTVCKISTDIVYGNPEDFETAVMVILVGSLLSAVLLFLNI